MIIVSESALSLKRFVAHTTLAKLAQAMVLKMMLAFMVHRGRMTCSQAAGSVASESIHRGQLTRFLARSRWQKHDFNGPLRKRLLMLESGRGEFVFILDATLISQAGQKTQNTYSTGNGRGARAKGVGTARRKSSTKSAIALPSVC